MSIGKWQFILWSGIFNSSYSRVIDCMGKMKCIDRGDNDGDNRVSFIRGLV